MPVQPMDQGLKRKNYDLLFPAAIWFLQVLCSFVYILEVVDVEMKGYTPGLKVSEGGQG